MLAKNEFISESATKPDLSTTDFLGDTLKKQ